MQGSRAEYFAGVDLLRFVAALGVVMLHLSYRTTALSHQFPVGWLGVQLFFVISGVVIAQSANGASPLHFVRHRINRLYPAAWCCLAVSVAALYLAAPIDPDLGLFVVLDRRSIVGAATLLSPHTVGSAYWTLPIELSFYGLVTLVLTGGAFGRVERVAIGLAAWSSMYLALLASGLILPFSYLRNGPWHFMAWNMTLLEHGVYFAIGMLLWMKEQGRLSRAGAVALSLAVIASFIQVWLRALTLAPLFAVPISPTGLAQSAVASWAVLLCAIAVAVLRNPKVDRHSRAGTILRQFGMATYPLYLMHECVGGGIMSMLAARGVPMLPGQIIAIIGVVATAFAIAGYAERPVRVWLNAVLLRIEKMLLQHLPPFAALTRPGGSVGHAYKTVGSNDWHS